MTDDPEMSQETGDAAMRLIRNVGDMTPGDRVSLVVAMRVGRRKVMDESLPLVGALDAVEQLVVAVQRALDDPPFPVDEMTGDAHG